MTAHPRRDDGVTLVELLICISLMGVLALVISGSITVALRNTPAVGDRSDAAINVQGLVAWLPQDVDSATPDSFVNGPAASGCAGTDPGSNVLKMTWTETLSATVQYTVSYRYVPQPVPADGGRIARVYCVAGTAPRTTFVTGLLPTWTTGAEPITSTLSDSSDPDTRTDTVRLTVRPRVGRSITIIATTKNLSETLTAPATTAPTETTQPPDLPPTAENASYVITSGVALTFGVSGSDPEGLPVTATIPAVPAGWTITATGALTFSATAPASADNTVVVVPFTITDAAGASGSGNVTFTVQPAGIDAPPVANASSASTTAGTAVVVNLNASDPEGAALTATVSGLPSGWTASVAGLAVTVTPSAIAAVGSYALDYVVRDPGAATASSTITVQITGPPPCAIQGPALSTPSVPLKKNNPDSLQDEVVVTITIVGGYCAGLALHYDTGAPNGQYVRNFGSSGTTRSVTLPRHPSPELWSTGTKVLNVKDSSSLVVGTVNLEVTP